MKPLSAKAMARKLNKLSEEMYYISTLLNEKMATKKAMEARFEYVFANDPTFARIAYDYFIRGHLAHGNTLRNKFGREAS